MPPSPPPPPRGAVFGFGCHSDGFWGGIMACGDEGTLVSGCCRGSGLEPPAGCQFWAGTTAERRWPELQRWSSAPGDVAQATTQTPPSVLPVRLQLTHQVVFCKCCGTHFNLGAPAACCPTWLLLAPYTDQSGAAGVPLSNSPTHPLLALCSLHVLHRRPNRPDQSQETDLGVHVRAGPALAV